MTAFWVWLDDEHGRSPGLAARMAGECARLAQAAGVRACGITRGRDAAASLVARGAANGLTALYAVEKPSQRSASDIAACLVDAVRSLQPLGLLLPATATGSDIAGRVAAGLQRGLLAGCVDVEWREQALHLRREVYAGRAHVVLTPTSLPPWILTLDPAVAHDNDFPACTPPLEELHGPAAMTEAAAPPECWRLAARELDVTDAEVVLAVGKGVDAMHTLPKVFELADLLDAAVGGSREAVFAGMVPRERQIGASGRWVAPKVYVALGISGSSYHLMGIREARHVAAVNLDAGAPMLERAEWRAVADVDLLIPALLRGLAPPRE